MSKFLKLYFEILIEHWRVQVFVYLVLLLSMLLSLSVLCDEIKLSYAMSVSVLCVLSLKLLSSIISLIKAYWIIRKCKEGNSYFLDVYREWTGRYF